MKEEKILKIIDEQGIFTVKIDNKYLFSVVRKMENEKKLEQKDHKGSHYYFGKPDGKPWTLRHGDGDHAGDYWTDRFW